MLVGKSFLDKHEDTNLNHSHQCKNSNMDVCAITRTLGIERSGSVSSLGSQSPGKRKFLCSLRDTVKGEE